MNIATLAIPDHLIGVLADTVHLLAEIDMLTDKAGKPIAADAWLEQQADTDNRDILFAVSSRFDDAMFLEPELTLHQEVRARVSAEVLKQMCAHYL